MMRTLVCAAVCIQSLAFLSAGAQTLSDASEASCPRSSLSIYFASGDVTVSPQTRELIGRIGEAAVSCEADGIDLVAHIEGQVDGERAVALALERLTLVAGDLVERGLPAERIRIAAQAGPRVGSGFSQIDVIVRKDTETPSEAAPARIRAQPGNAI